MQNFVQRGESITVLAPATLTSGSGVKVGTKFGIASFDATSGAQLEISTVGVFDLAKDTSTFADGDPVYWDDTAKKATSTASGNSPIGSVCLTQPSGTNALGALTGDATVRVRLNGTSVGATTSVDSSIVATGTVSLTSANILAMNATPVQILAAPGAGKALIAENILFEMTTTSTQYASGGAVSFVLHGGSTAIHSGSVPASVVTATAGTSYTMLGPATATNGTTLTANTGIDITNATAAFTTGTGTAKVQIKYRIVTL